MRRLILVKHSLPHKDAAVPAADWGLSDAGQERCKGLAAVLRRYLPAVLITSTEPKALETGKLVAGHLGIGFHSMAGLHEQDRRNVGYLPESEFQQRMAELFTYRNNAVFGRESAGAAEQRFSEAIEQLLAANRSGSVMVVGHGTVISLFVARYNMLDIHAFWQRLGLPAVVELGLPDFKLMSVEGHIE